MGSPSWSSVHRHAAEDALLHLVVVADRGASGCLALPADVTASPATTNALEVLVKWVEHATAARLDDVVVLGRDQQFVAEVKADILDHLASFDVIDREGEAHVAVAEWHASRV